MDTSGLAIGVDVGTSGCRALALDFSSQALCGRFQASLPAPLRRDEACEQDPALWWTGLCQVLEGLGRSIPRANTATIAVDGTSGTLLLANALGEPMGSALLYSDTQAMSELAMLAPVVPADSVVLSAGASLAKLLYLQKRQTDKADYALHQADWLMGRLMGRYGFSDENNALKLGYDAQQRRWPVWLESLGVSSLLPQVCPPGQPLFKLLPALAARFALPLDTWVVAGTTDSTAAFLATGATEVGEAVSSLGSTLVLKVLADVPLCRPALGIYSQRLGDRWLCGGASNTGGAVLQRYFSLAQINILSQQLRPDCPSGLHYYPLPAQGERFPINDPGLRPVLTPRPAEDALFLQGMLEGMARIEQQGYQKLAECGAPYPTSIRSVGGGAVNQAWQQIRARLLGVPLLAVAQEEAAYGSAILALRALRTVLERKSPSVGRC